MTKFQLLHIHDHYLFPAVFVFGYEDIVVGIDLVGVVIFDAIKGKIDRVVPRFIGDWSSGCGGRFSPASSGYALDVST